MNKITWFNNNNIINLILNGNLFIYESTYSIYMRGDANYVYSKRRRKSDRIRACVDSRSLAYRGNYCSTSEIN